MWKEAPEGECYLADGSGSKICGQEFPLSLREGDATTLPWTLSNYMKISGNVYPSRVRLYCVNIHGQCNGEFLFIFAFLLFQSEFFLFLPEENEASPSHSHDFATLTTGLV